MFTVFYFTHHQQNISSIIMLLRFLGVLRYLAFNIFGSCVCSGLKKGNGWSLMDLLMQFGLKTWTPSWMKTRSLGLIRFLKRVERLEEFFLVGPLNGVVFIYLCYPHLPWLIHYLFEWLSSRDLDLKVGYCFFSLRKCWTKEVVFEQRRDHRHVTQHAHHYGAYGCERGWSVQTCGCYWLFLVFGSGRLSHFIPWWSVEVSFHTELSEPWHLILGVWSIMEFQNFCPWKDSQDDHGSSCRCFWKVVDPLNRQSKRIHWRNTLPDMFLDIFNVQHWKVCSKQYGHQETNNKLPHHAQSCQPWMVYCVYCWILFCTFTVYLYLGHVYCLLWSKKFRVKTSSLTAK